MTPGHVPVEIRSACLGNRPLLDHCLLGVRPHPEMNCTWRQYVSQVFLIVSIGNCQLFNGILFIPFLQPTVSACLFFAILPRRWVAFWYRPLDRITGSQDCTAFDNYCLLAMVRLVSVIVSFYFSSVKFGPCLIRTSNLRKMFTVASPATRIRVLLEGEGTQAIHSSY